MALKRSRGVIRQSASVARLLIPVLVLFCGDKVGAHGGVVFDEDLCVIEIGLFKAHFTIYQPESRASEEFCEDVPDVSNSVFVMDYMHDSLREVPVDFRIIKDVQNRTLYAARCITIRPKQGKMLRSRLSIHLKKKAGTRALSQRAIRRWTKSIRLFSAFMSGARESATGHGFCC
jgi:hypothetical protein